MVSIPDRLIRAMKHQDVPNMWDIDLPTGSSLSKYVMARWIQLPELAHKLYQNAVYIGGITGSTVRGSARPTSDIDMAFMLEVNPNHKLYRNGKYDVQFKRLNKKYPQLCLHAFPREGFDATLEVIAGDDPTLIDAEHLKWTQKYPEFLHSDPFSMISSITYMIPLFSSGFFENLVPFRVCRVAADRLENIRYQLIGAINRANPDMRRHIAQNIVDDMGSIRSKDTAFLSFLDAHGYGLETYQYHVLKRLGLEKDQQRIIITPRK